MLSFVKTRLPWNASCKNKNKKMSTLSVKHNKAKCNKSCACISV